MFWRATAILIDIAKVQQIFETTKYLLYFLHYKFHFLCKVLFIRLLRLARAARKATIFLFLQDFSRVKSCWYQYVSCFILTWNYVKYFYYKKRQSFYSFVSSSVRQFIKCKCNLCLNLELLYILYIIYIIYSIYSKASLHPFLRFENKKLTNWRIDELTNGHVHLLQKSLPILTNGKGLRVYDLSVKKPAAYKMFAPFLTEKNGGLHSSPFTNVTRTEVNPESWTQRKVKGQTTVAAHGEKQRLMTLDFRPSTLDTKKEPQLFFLLDVHTMVIPGRSWHSIKRKYPTCSSLAPHELTSLSSLSRSMSSNIPNVRASILSRICSFLFENPRRWENEKWFSRLFSSLS